MSERDDNHAHEIWKPVVGHGDYEISSHGRVKSLARFDTIGRRVNEKLLSPQTDEYGYIRVRLVRDGKRIRIFVHTLLLTAFVGPRPKGKQCRHLDGVKTHNRLGNLCWGDEYDQCEDKRRHGTHICGERSPNSKLTPDQVVEIRKRKRDGENGVDLAKKFGVSNQLIYAVVNRVAWRHLPG
jgi:hypothetical protein